MKHGIVSRLHARPPRRRLGLAAVILVAVFSMSASIANADAFGSYVHVGTFELPTGAAAFDVAGDGSIMAIVDDALYLEDGVGAGSFSLLGVLPTADIASFGAAFLRVSPDGTKFAVGNNGGAGGVYQVGVFDALTLAGAWFTADHFDAEWADDTYLAITAGDFAGPSVVTLLDTADGDPLNAVIIEGINGASAGIAFDAFGNLYTGNGFSFGDPGLTGEVRAFTFASWTAAATGGTPLDFNADGTAIINILSASPLGFDTEGNLYVGGGGDEADFVALAKASAVADAMAGAGAIDIGDPALVRGFDPDDANPSNFYSANHNAATGELMVRDYGASTVHAHAPMEAVPTVSQWGIASMVLLLLAGGTVAFRAEPRGRSLLSGVRT